MDYKMIMSSHVGPVCISGPLGDETILRTKHLFIKSLNTYVAETKMPAILQATFPNSFSVWTML